MELCLRYPLSTHHPVFFLTLFTLTFNISPLFTNAHINIPSSPALMAISISPKPPYLPFYSSLPSSFSLTLPLKPKSWQALHLSLLLSLRHTRTHIHWVYWSLSVFFPFQVPQAPLLSLPRAPTTKWANTHHAKWCHWHSPCGLRRWWHWWPHISCSRHSRRAQNHQPQRPNPLPRHTR